MTKFEFFRKWIAALNRLRPATDLLILILALSVFFYHAPKEVLNSNPATGGDTGSHYWPLVTLVEQGLPHGEIRVWNPGNLGGEPHLTHYFPLPYLIMAFLSLFMPLGRAFNIGTILPVAALPLCVFLCFRWWRTRFPIPALATMASLAFLYNESFSMWGGNALSTLAGQFAHVYAYCFFLLGTGALASAMGRKQFPWLGMFCFAAVLISHFYVALFLPVVFLCFLIFERTEDLRLRLKKLFFCGFGALALSAWFVGPMLHNSKWNTAFGLKWSGSQLLQEAFPPLFWPFAAVSVFLMILFLILRWNQKAPEKEWQTLFPLMLSIFGVGIVYYFIFPPLGLVDIRVLPTLQLFLCLMAAVLVGLLFRRFLPSAWIWFFTLPLALVILWWSARGIQNFPHWMKWNYSGWEAKSAYPDLQALAEQVRGDFSQGRIIYENSELSNSAGTMRVFEMLPYFANRSTLESVYMQATTLAPAAFYLQALISKTPSCPFPNYQCTSYDVARLRDYMSLMGVDRLILINDEVIQQADHLDFLKKEKQFGLWHVYQSLIPAPLVEVPKLPLEFTSEKNFKSVFYDWFLKYTQQSPYLVVAKEPASQEIANSVGGECHPLLDVTFNRMTLKTDCPGKFHVVKFAFHSTWKASTGDKLYLTSPGFIGIIPSAPELELAWGHHWLWTASNAISWLALSLCGFLFWRTRQRRFK